MDFETGPSISIINPALELISDKSVPLVIRICQFRIVENQPQILLEEKNNELLQYVIDNGIIDLSYAETQLELKKEKNYEINTHMVFEGKGR